MSSWFERYFCGKYIEELDSAYRMLLQYEAQYGKLKYHKIPIYEVSDNFVRSKISAICKLSYVPSDRVYRVTDQNSMVNVILAQDWVHRLQYIPEYFDCDDFALAFKVLTAKLTFEVVVGLVYDWSSMHAYNIAVFPTGNIMLIEPQTASIFNISQRNLSQYALKDGIILF